MAPLPDSTNLNVILQVLNPAYSLPFAEYEREGHEIIMYGDPAMTTAGHVNGGVHCATDCAQDFWSWGADAWTHFQATGKAPSAWAPPHCM